MPDASGISKRTFQTARPAPRRTAAAGPPGCLTVRPSARGAFRQGEPPPPRLSEYGRRLLERPPAPPPGVQSAGRRQELLAWARACGAYVIEDDCDGEYRYDVAPIPILQSLDGGRNVLYLGTLSKILSPALRLGCLVVPPSLGAAFRAAKRLADRHSPSLEQEALADLIASGAYERHVRRVRRRNGERRAALLAALRAGFGERVRVVGADAGLHVVVWFTRLPMEREAALVAAARAAGVGVHPVTPLYEPSSPAGRPDHPGLVMGYASLDERAIASGIDRLAATLADFV